MIDSIPVQAALLDRNGRIVAINDHWRRFAEANGFADSACGLGSNYVDVCRSADGAFSAEARVVAQGISDVLVGGQPEFSLVYPCHSPNERRWFRLLASRTEAGDGAVVLHFNITPERLSEESQVAARIESERRLTEIEATLKSREQTELRLLTSMSRRWAKADESIARIIASYAVLIDDRLAAVAYRLDGNLRQKAIEIAEELGKIGADASLVSYVHVEALRRSERQESQDKALWVTQEARMVFIGVLGYLANYYRDRLQTGPGA